MSMRVSVLCALLLVGCGASWDTAVIGRSPLYTVAMWRGAEVRGIEARRNEQIVPITWTDALGVGLSPTWALVDYHEVTDAGADGDHVVVEGLHRVDGTERFPLIAPLVESALSRQAVWVAAHRDDTEAALAPFAGATVVPSEPRVVEIRWIPGRIEIRASTTFGATIARVGCGEVVVGGIDWARTWEVATDGTVTPITEDVSQPLEAAPCR